MGAVFVSYRRGDAEGQARALYNELEELVGRDSVFMDVDSIDLGRDFREVLQERLQSCDQLLALIGPRWLDAQDAAGNRRLDQASDFVRQEIAAALKRKIPVTPILVQGAQMPAPERLPEELKDLAFRNAFELSHNRWESDLHEMVRRLRLRRDEARPNSPGPGAVAAGADARSASTATGANQFEREHLEPVPVRGASWPRWLRWMMKLALFVLLGGFIVGMIAGILEELPQTEKSPDPRPPAAGPAAPAEPRADATNPALSPQAGPEAAKATAAAQTIIGLLGEAKFNTLWRTHVSDWFKEHNDKDKTLARWSSTRESLGSHNGSRIIDVVYSQKDPGSGWVGDIYTVQFLDTYDARSLYVTVVLKKEPDGQFRLANLRSANVPQD